MGWGGDPDYDHPDMHGSLFPGAREVCIDARRAALCHRGEAGPGTSGDSVTEALADALCPPCLERMEIRSGSEWPSIPLLEGPHTTRTVWQWLLFVLILARDSQYTFEICDGLEKRVSWRRLPADGTPEHHDAKLSTINALLWNQGSVAQYYMP